mgnify:CR=1 FL=1
MVLGLSAAKQFIKTICIVPSLVLYYGIMILENSQRNNALIKLGESKDYDKVEAGKL